MKKKEIEIQDALGTLSTFVVSGSVAVHITITATLSFSLTTKALDSSSAKKNIYKMLKTLPEEQRKDLILDSLNDMTPYDMITVEDIDRASQHADADEFNITIDNLHHVHKREGL